MTNRWIAATLAAMIALPVSLPTEAAAQRRGDYRWQGDRNNGWDPSRHYHAGRYRERRLGRDDRIYRGGDGRYYCRRNDGTTGLVIGGAVGALVGHELDGGRDHTVGTILGAAGGALLGREIDRSHLKCS